MKQILLFLAIVVCVSLVTVDEADAQGLMGWKSKTPFNSLTYADDDIDTSATYLFGAADQITLRTYVSDSADVVYLLDYRVWGATSWTVITAVSADSVTTTDAGYAQIILRDNATERLAGVAVQFRIRAEFQSSANSADEGAVHSGWLNYSN